MRSRLALAVLLLASTAASSQTVTVNYKVFGGAKGEVLAPFSVFQATPGKVIILGAPKQIVVQDTASPTKPKTYAFLFWEVPSAPPVAGSWVVPGGPTTNTEAIFKVPPGGAHTSAWYQLVGDPCTVKCGPPMSYVSAFAEDDDEPITGTPVASVTPAGLWPVGPSDHYVKTSNKEVAITANASMQNKKFHLWLPVSSASASGDKLKVAAQDKAGSPANVGVGIAFYSAGPTPPINLTCLINWEAKLEKGWQDLGVVLNQQPPSPGAIHAAVAEIGEAEAELLACSRTGNSRPNAPVH